jgi:hypothetical protein
MDFRGVFPKNGATVTEDITLVGNDETVLIIKGGVNIIYTSTPTAFFEGNAKRGSWLYQFQFPIGTTVNPNTTQYTTPTNTVYIFTGTTDHHISDGSMIRNMMNGTVIVKPPSLPSGTSSTPSTTTAIAGKSTEIYNTTGEGVKQAGQEIGKGLDKGIAGINQAGDEIKLLIDNAALLESSIAGKMDNFFSDEDSPFYKIALIIYKVAMDMFVVIIFWILFISISCWLKIPAEYIYPTKVTEYPYVYFEEGKKTNWDASQKGDDQLCKPLSEGQAKVELDQQNKRLAEMKSNLGDENIGILKIIYPEMLDPKEANIPQFSKMVLEKCQKGELCTMDYLIYFVGVLCLTNYVYCSTIVGGMHTAASFFTEKVFANIPAKLSTILFSALLYYLFLGVTEINKTVIQMFNIDIKEGLDMKGKMQEHFFRILVSILSVIVSVAIPLITILIIGCLLSTIYILCKTCLFPYNFAVLFISFITLFFSMTQYIVLIKSLMANMDPLSLLEKIYVKEIKLETFASFLGITVPIFFGFVYGGLTAFKLFFHFFQFMNMPNVKAIMQRGSASLVIVGLLLLLFHVKEDLGNMFFFMTIIIVVLVGLYMLTKTS